jgi:hypothetical protein
MLLLALSTSNAMADVIYKVTGTTFLDVEGSGFIAPVEGILIGDDDLASLVGTLVVDGAGTYPIDSFLLATSPALAAFGVPAQATVGSPDTVGVPGGLSGVSINYVDFERGALDSFSFEKIPTWESAIGFFGTGPGQDGERFGATLEFHPVPNPEMFVMGLIGAVCCLGGMVLKRKA